MGHYTWPHTTSLSLFLSPLSFNGFKSQLLSALEENFIVLTVVTERNTQFER